MLIQLNSQFSLLKLSTAYLLAIQYLMVSAENIIQVILHKLSRLSYVFVKTYVYV